MKIIRCENNNILLDDEDYNFINDLYDVYLNAHGYAMVKLKNKYRKLDVGLYTNQSLHKLLIHPDPTGRGINIDHQDGNKLNNQKSNLRICTHSENMKNRKPNKTYSNKQPKSKYKGVWIDKKMKMWRSQIIHNNSKFYVGCFTNEMAAANAYNYFAKKFHGEFANLNEVEFMHKEEWEKYKTGNNKTSNYLGVSFINGKWIAQICHDYQRERIGSFDDEIKAAEAYNKRATELKGEKAKLN